VVAAATAVAGAIVVAADVDTAALAGTHTLREVLDVLVVCSHSARSAALAIVVATALNFVSGAVFAAAGAFAHTVPAALLAAACTTEVLEEAGHTVAEAVARAVQAAQNELELGALVAAVRFGCGLEVVVGAAAGGLEGIAAAVVHIVAVSAVETHRSDQIGPAMGEVVVALAVAPDSPVHRSWDRRLASCT
jgi:hypothetical protein